MTPAQLKTIRKKLGLTQEQLGAELLVDRNTINRWEMGLYRIDPTAAKLLKILCERQHPPPPHQSKMKVTFAPGNFPGKFGEGK